MFFQKIASRNISNELIKRNTNEETGFVIYPNGMLRIKIHQVRYHNMRVVYKYNSGIEIPKHKTLFREHGSYQ